MILNLIGVAGGCSNEGDLEQGQSEFDLQFLLVGWWSEVIFLSSQLYG